MIGAFLEHVPARVEVLLAGGTHDAAMRTAHAIKSSAGNLGLERLRLVAQEIEARAELGDDSWSQLRAALAAVMDEARAVLTQRMEGGE
jgi:HPt (histidine-containing phosphotransfer) domain-containing protein